MDYVDPHHKRISFSAASFHSEPEDSGGRVIFFGHDSRQTITIADSGLQIAAKVSGEDGSFVLWKVQILERIQWLTLDIKNNPRLSRIVVHIERLNFDDLDAALRRVFGDRDLLYFRQASKETGGSSHA